MDNPSPLSGSRPIVRRVPEGCGQSEERKVGMGNRIAYFEVGSRDFETLVSFYLSLIHI